jgi:Protein kinase domain
MTNRIGQNLGNYHLVRLLGEGGFAEVYLGEHIHLGTKAAIKVLHTQLTADDIEAFRNEARTIAQLEHPYIVRVLDFGVEGKTPFLVMGYAENNTLRHRHPKGTRLPLTTVLLYIKQIADALQYAHDEKVIHRDVKPENMLIGRRQEILLSDFGIAVTPGATSNQNEVGMPIMNTIGQMAAMNLQGNVMLTAADYNAFVAHRGIFTQVPPNPLQAAWESGITAYYSQHYQDAIKDFQTVESLNPNFTAAKMYELKATALSHSQSNPSEGRSVTPSGNATFFGIPKSAFLIIGIFGGLLVLSVLLIILSVWARRRHKVARWEAERAEVQRNAESEVQQMQRTKLQIQTEHDQPLDRRKDSTVNPQSPANTLCPNCGHTVRVDATYCPNCRYQLSPLARSALPTLNISPVPVLPIIDKDFAPSTTIEQPPIKETVQDELAIQATLKRLWDKAS